MSNTNGGRSEMLIDNPRNDPETKQSNYLANRSSLRKADNFVIDRRASDLPLISVVVPVTTKKKGSPGSTLGFVKVASRRTIGARTEIGMQSLLIGGALLVAVAQLMVGVPMTGRFYAHDGPFAVATLVAFQDELHAGHLIPRWAASGNAGLGSPIFMFYPPGAYDAAAAIGLLLRGLSAATIIGVTQVLLRGGAMLACFLWLRRRTSRTAALIGSAFYVLMPWIAIGNPQMRLDFAECAATALVPLAFLAVDAGLAIDARHRLLTTISLVALTMCSLTFLHLPTTVITGGLIVTYAALSNTTWREGLIAAASTAAGVALGLGMAGWYVLPALGLLHTISSAGWWLNSMADIFLLMPSTFHSLHGLLFNTSLIVPVLLAAPFCWNAVAERNLLLGVSRGTSLSLVATFAIAVFLTLPLSGPIWAALPPLRMVQFPARFLVPISLLAAGLIAIKLPSCADWLRRLTLTAGLALAAVGMSFAVWSGDGMSSGELRTWQALHPYPVVPEYIPADAGASGWLGADHTNDTAAMWARAPGLVARATEMVSPCVQRLDQSKRVDDAQLTFNVAGCTGTTWLPQFYFPGWVVEAGAHILPAVADPASGLVAIVIPSGTETVTLRRTWLPIELLGLMTSGLSLALWLGMVWIMLVRGGPGLPNKPSSGSNQKSALHADTNLQPAPTAKSFSDTFRVCQQETCAQRVA